MGKLSKSDEQLSSMEQDSGQCSRNTSCETLGKNTKNTKCADVYFPCRKGASCIMWMYDIKKNFSSPFQTTQRTTTPIMTSSTRTCQLGKTCLQYRWEGAWAPCLSLTASPLPQSLDSIPHIPASVLLPPSSSQNTGPHSPIKLIPYSPPASALHLPCPRRSDAAPRQHPSPTAGQGCCTSATPPSMTTCQKKSCTQRRLSPFSHPSHPCPRQMGACSLPSTWPVRMQTSPPAHPHCQKRKADTVSEGKGGAGDIMREAMKARKKKDL